MTAPDETAARLTTIEWVKFNKAWWLSLPHGQQRYDEIIAALSAPLPESLPTADQMWEMTTAPIAPPPELTPEEWNKVRGIFALAEAHGVECAELWTKLRHPVVDTEGK